MYERATVFRSRVMLTPCISSDFFEEEPEPYGMFSKSAVFMPAAEHSTMSDYGYSSERRAGCPWSNPDLEQPAQASEQTPS